MEEGLDEGVPFCRLRREQRFLLTQSLVPLFLLGRDVRLQEVACLVSGAVRAEFIHRILLRHLHDGGLEVHFVSLAGVVAAEYPLLVLARALLEPVAAIRLAFSSQAGVAEQLRLIRLNLHGKSDAGALVLIEWDL